MDGNVDESMASTANHYPLYMLMNMFVGMYFNAEIVP